ncbi:MAG: MerR family transcriptional regulator, partial [Actinomycetota bacterium]|nr:MerR family transcriptional regulator [Actinomycetota bacterium]
GRSVMVTDHLSIGEVLSLLQSDFPDVTISKIRFLESQGLIDPERTPSGYRKFGQEDIDVLEWILREQRDHFLPLKVIRERIERGDHLAPPEPEAAPVEPELGGGVDDSEAQAEAARHEHPLDSTTTAAGTMSAGGPLAAEMASLSMTAEELSAASGLSSLELQELETYGLLTSRSLGPTTYYDGEALLVARAAKEFGEHGVEPRHLRLFRTAA